MRLAYPVLIRVYRICGNFNRLKVGVVTNFFGYDTDQSKYPSVRNQSVRASVAMSCCVQGLILRSFRSNDARRSADGISGGSRKEVWTVLTTSAGTGSL